MRVVAVWHPLLVHFPITLLLIGGILQVLVLWKPNWFANVTMYTIGLGLVSGIAAYLSGDDAEDYARSHFADVDRHLVHQHEDIARNSLIVFGVILALELLRRFGVKIPGIRWIQAGFAVLGVVLIVITGHLGGSIVYKP